MPCHQPTTRPSAPCAWPSSPGASASEREPRKGAPPTPPPCPSSKLVEGAASIPGHTSPTLSPAPERTCITSRFLSQFEREGGERLHRHQGSCIYGSRGSASSAACSGDGRIPCSRSGCQPPPKQ